MLSLHPFSGARIGLTVTNLLGDIKGEWFTDSATAACDKARETAGWPDTRVYLYDVDAEGNPVGQPFAVVYREGVGEPKWHPLA